MSVCLGLDTSCYTTSAALCTTGSGAGDSLFLQKRRLLTVRPGARGLMQSEGVFQHVSRLPALVEELLAECPAGCRVEAVCASVRPRPAPDSYMPVFRVGEGFGRALAAALRAPFYPATHQEGHLRAARVGTGLAPDAPCLALHLSGGTTEVLRQDAQGITRLGGTRDLHAGQLVDRVGVALGLGFPAGPALERLATDGQAAARYPASLRGLDCHLSGAETRALADIRAGVMAPEDIAAEVFDCLARTVARLVLGGCGQSGLCDALLGGGVASSSLLREQVKARVAARNRRIRLHFARPELSGDNAVGVALMGIDRLISTQKEAREHGGDVD